MGLAGPKRRSKLAHDPNNTAWSSSSNSYGQKILSAQGWKPGDYLGAANASHADHYTIANKSHIKVLLREDNLGLGASVGKSNADTFGLTLYSGVLSRLNGKDDAQVEQQQKAMRDAELRSYQANKYGFMNFVSAGVLVGDTIEPAGPKDAGRAQKRSAAVDDHDIERAKKQKVDAPPVDAVDDATAKLDRRSSKERRRHKHKTTAESSNSNITKQRQQLNRKESQSTPDVSGMDEEYSVAKAMSKKKSRQSLDEIEPEAAGDLQDDGRPNAKEEKRARKEKRRRRKEERRRAESDPTAAPVEKTDRSITKGSDARPGGGRLAVRHRYIHQKRLASLDPQAMKEIFMFQSAA